MSAITFHNGYYKMSELAQKVDEHPAVKGKSFPRKIHVLALSNDNGVDFGCGMNECVFRRMLVDRNYAVARRSQERNTIGISQKMREHNMDEAVKVTVAYLYYKNGLLTNEKNEVIE